VPSLSLTQSPAARTGDVGDTVVVRGGKIVQFTRIPDIPDVSLEGVLRSELVDALTAHLSKYLRNPSVRAVPLLRLAVLGAVGHPGWYSMRSDVVLADVIMEAGGVNNESDVPNTVVRRAGDVIWTAADVRTALSEGASLDRLNLRAGDEILVATKRRWSVLNTVQAITALAGVVVAARALR
jgi:protein involved in polysaccharide export with SLBB domain